MTNEAAAKHRAWYIVGLLVLLFCMSFVDRMILALLAAPISRTLVLSDTKVGLLYGGGFGVLYALIGLPLAQLIDRGRRVWIIAVGVVLWSLCTIASGFSSSFGELVVYRSGVALGEAVLSPAALSIIADLFPRSERTPPTAIYTSVGVVMGMGAFFVGGAALSLATSVAKNVEPWRLTLVFVGLPGLLLLAILLLTVNEPQRVAARRGFLSAEQRAEIGWAATYLARQ